MSAKTDAPGSFYREKRKTFASLFVCAVTQVHILNMELAENTFASAQIEMVPQNYQKLESEEHIKLMEKLIEIMEDDDDVQNVWHNWEE